MVDDGWDEGTDTEVDEPAPMVADNAAARPPTGPLPPPPVPPSPPAYAPSPPAPPRVEQGSVTEVDSLLESIDDEVDTLATVRREDIEHMLGAPPPDAYAPPAPVPEPAVAPAMPAPVPAAVPAAMPAAVPAAMPPAMPAAVPAAAPAMPAAVPAAASEPAPASSPVGVTPPYAQVDVRYTGEPATSLVGGAPGVGAALGLKVRLVGSDVPMWLPVLLALAGAGVCCAVIGFVIGRAGRAASPAASVAPPVATSAAPAGSVAPVPTSLIERASAGDPAAVKELEGRSSLDTDAALALSRGKMMERRHELEKLGAKLKAKPALAADRAVRKQLMSAVRDPETSRVALRIMATLPSSDGPDLLYETWTGTPRRTEATRLAEELVHEKDVRARASPALAVALDLRDAKTCADDKKLLAAAKDHGDRRSWHELAMLQRHFGCGPRKKQDCYDCLRDNDDLSDAIKAVRRRAGPKF